MSVVVPSYNHGAYIEEALDSILTQTFPPKEIIIVDDGSGDNTSSILENYQKYANIIINKQNIGAALTTNKGIQAASQKYICILNSDDRWKKNKLEIQYEHLRANGLDLSFGLADIIDKDSNFVSEPPVEFQNFRRFKPSGNNYFKHFFYLGNFLCHPSIMISKSVYDECGMYDNRYRQLPDFEMWIRISKSKFAMSVCPETLVDFRWTPGANTSDQLKFANFARTQNEHLLIFNEFFNGLSRDRISKDFAVELQSIYANQPLYREMDPSLALLLNHTDQWLGSLSKLSGIQQFFVTERSESLDLFIQQILSEGYWSMQYPSGIISSKRDLEKLKKYLYKFRKFLGSVGDFR